MMSIVRLQVLLEAEAEEAIARVWRVVEAHAIGTPHVTVTHRAGIAIELSFALSDDAECVAKALRSATLSSRGARASKLIAARDGEGYVAGIDDNGLSDRTGNGGGALDPELRKRVADALAEFERCFDAAVARPTSQKLDALREATDRLMRAGARVLMELESS